jgi:hypothetical protein
MVKERKLTSYVYYFLFSALFRNQKMNSVIAMVLEEIDWILGVPAS